MSFPRVIVVGAGPAGSAAAITLRMANIPVTVVDRCFEPRDRPGETLHPGVEPLFKQLGILSEVHDAQFHRHLGHWVFGAGRSHFVPFGADASGPWRGFQAPSVILDGLLRKRALALGAQLLTPVRVWAPIVHAGRIVGLKTDRGAMHADWVIDASGSHHRLARALGRSLRYASPRLIAHYGYETHEAHDLEAPRMTLAPGAWSWRAPLGDGRVAWVRLDFEKNHKVPKGARGVHVSWRRLEIPACPGYIAVGDAAVVLDPASSHGVLRALMTGIAAASLIQRVTEGRDMPDALQAYNRMVRHWSTHDVAHLVTFYRQAPISAAFAFQQDGPLWRDHVAFL